MPFPVAAVIGAVASAASAAAAAERQKRAQQAAANRQSQDQAMGQMDKLGQQQSLGQISFDESAPQQKSFGLGGFDLNQVGSLMQPQMGAAGPSPALGAIAPVVGAATAALGADPSGAAAAPDVTTGASAIGDAANQALNAPVVSDAMKTVSDVAAPAAEAAGTGVNMGPSHTSAWDDLAPDAAKTWGTNDQMSNLGAGRSFSSLSSATPDTYGLKSLPTGSSSAGFATETPGADEFMKTIGDVESPVGNPGGIPPDVARAGEYAPDSWGRFGKIMAEKAAGSAVNGATALAMQQLLRRKKPKYGTGGGFSGFYGR